MKIHAQSLTAHVLEVIYHSLSRNLFRKQGRVTPLGAGWQYEYTLSDHLGNARVSFADKNGDGLISTSSNDAEILQTKSYYPFGLTHSGIGIQAPEENLYQYNGKELQSELGIYDYGARNYNPSIGRLWPVDPLAEKMTRFSPYNYAWDNPIMFVDPDGMFATPPLDFYDQNGNQIGTDGVDDGRKAVVTDKKVAKAIKKTDKSGGTTELSTVSSMVVLPSDTALQESVNVLDRTVSNGGKKEESSIVMKDGTIVQGESGPEVEFGKDAYAGTTLPDLPDGAKTTEVETTIHSHPTATEVVGDQVYSSDATAPSPGQNRDQGTFNQYDTNIIVGPLGLATGTKENGNVRVSQPGLGIVIYNKNSSERLRLKINAVKKILE